MTNARVFHSFLAAAAALLAVSAASFAADNVAGQASLTYQYRRAQGDGGFPNRSDQDIDFLGAADARNLLSGRAEGHVTFRAFKDIDGTAPADPLRGIGESYGNRDDLRVYEGYLSFRPASLPMKFSLGRQYVPAGFGYAQAFDGGSVDAKFADARVRLLLFGGARVSHFVNPDRSAIVGGKAIVKPFPGTVLELSDLKYTEHLLEAAATQSFLRDQRVSARFSSIGDDPERFSVNGHFHGPRGLSGSLEYVRKIGRGADRDEFPFDFTSLDDAVVSRLRIGAEAPFARYAGNVRKRIGPRLTLGLEGERRKLIHDVDEDDFNRSAWRAGASVDVRDFPFRGLSAFVMYGHLWEDRLRTPDGSSGVATAGLSYAVNSALSVGAEFFANSVAQTVSEPLLPGGAAAVDREETGGAGWAQWSGARCGGRIRYEYADDGLYNTYGVKAIHSVTATIQAAL